MTEIPIDPTLSNPFSTSGAGNQFEYLIGASYLVSLLSGDIPRGLDWGQTVEVRFQQRFAGIPVDDIIIVGSDGANQRILALQIKHELTFSDSETNVIFQKVIRECWLTFIGAYGFEFNIEKDRIGIGVGTYNANLDKHLRPVLELARKSRDADDFLKKVHLPDFSHKTKIGYIDAFRNLLTKAKGSPLTNEEFWNFLKCLVILHFDLENEGSRDTIQCWNRLRDQIPDGDFKRAITLFSLLINQVAIFEKNAGTINRIKLRDLISSSSIPIKDYQEYYSDLRKLHSHSDLVLSSIRDTIGEQCQLPRLEILDSLEIKIQENDVTIITGEPSVGKSVLLKLFANRLKSQGEIIFFSVERFDGSSLDQFLHNINVTGEFGQLLWAMSSAPQRCILIDSAEYANSEDTRRILKDILVAVRNYNSKLQITGGHEDYFWKIVIASREETIKNLLIDSDLNKIFSLFRLGNISDSEFSDVVKEFPKFKELMSNENLQDLMLKPLILDILTLPDFDISLQNTTDIVSEASLRRKYWQKIVRLADKTSHVKGNPDSRERLLFDVSIKHLQNQRYEIIQEKPEEKDVTGLISDRILLKENGILRHSHDTIRDWSFVQLLMIHEDNITEFLIKFQESPQLFRSLQIFGEGIIENNDTKKWLDIYNSLDQNLQISPYWSQVFLSSLVTSPLRKQNIEAIAFALFANESQLLVELLKIIKTICTKPNLVFYKIFIDVPKDDREKLLSHFTIPNHRQWDPVINLVLKNPEALQGKLLIEFADIAKEWMQNTRNKEKYRKDIAILSIKLLENKLLKDYNEQPKFNYLNSVFWAADVIPDQVEEFLKKYAIRNHDCDIRGFEELLLKSDCVPIYRYLPETALDIYTSILCKPIEPDNSGSYYHLFHSKGITLHGSWHPPTYLKGPFTGFLRLHPQEGLELIHRIVNHATKVWILEEESQFGEKPIPQIIHIDGNDISINGDDSVFSWFRYLSVAPDAVISALMALEHWSIDQIKSGVDPKSILHPIINKTNSAAIVGVYVSVCFAHIEKCAELLVPIMENPAFWFMDTQRLLRDHQYPASILTLSIFNSRSSPDMKTLIKDSELPHRKKSIRTHHLEITLRISGDPRTRLLESMKSFPENIPYFFENEKQDIIIYRDRLLTCKIWAAEADSNNYKIIEDPEKGLIGKQFVMPKELEAEIKKEEELDNTRIKNNNLLLLNWSYKFLMEGRIGTGFTVETAMEYARQLVAQDNPSYIPFDVIDDIQTTADAIALFANAMVIQNWIWVENNGHIQWCIDQILIASSRPEPPTTKTSYMIYSFGCTRSAARTFPFFILRGVSNAKIRKSIIRLASHSNDEVRQLLFSSLGELWNTDQKIIFHCIQIALDSSIIHESRISKILADLKIRRLSPFEYTSDKIHFNRLQLILCCFPRADKFNEIQDLEDFFKLFNQISQFSYKNYHYYRQKKEEYNWSYLWTAAYSETLANIILRYPDQDLRYKYCDQVLSQWEKTPAIMEHFLQGFLICGSNSVFKERFIAIWKKFAIQIINSELIRKKTKHQERALDSILGLVIFSDPQAIITWKTKRWELLPEFFDIIKLWCDNVGQHSNCFPNLIRLLKSIGFEYMPDQGIKWIYECLQKVTDTNEFIKEGRVGQIFSELMYDSWSEQRERIISNQSNLVKFNHIVGILVKSGQPVAITLQRKIEREVRI